MNQVDASKPRIFIGSSREGLTIAEHIQSQLHWVADCTVWSQGVFGLSRYPLESLAHAVRQSDYAILVLTPDDVTTKRAKTMASPRDNVLFELGLFIGGLGREHTFIVRPQGEPLGLPSDLEGWPAATWPRDFRGNMPAALGPAVLELKIAMGLSGQ